MIPNLKFQKDFKTQTLFIDWVYWASSYEDYRLIWFIL